MIDCSVFFHNLIADWLFTADRANEVDKNEENAEKVWELLNELVKDTEKIPVAAIVEVAGSMMGIVKEVGQAVLPMVTNVMSAAPVIGPLPLILYKACVAIGQAVANQKGAVI